MKFEEQFPELKGKVFNRPLKMGGAGIFPKFVRVEAISEHCLSKQRVKEAINEAFNIYEEERNLMSRKYQLLRELGFDEVKNRIYNFKQR